MACSNQTKLNKSQMLQEVAENEVENWQKEALFFKLYNGGKLATNSADVHNRV